MCCSSLATIASTSGLTCACAGACQFQLDQSGYRTAAAPITSTPAAAPIRRFWRSRSSGNATAAAAIAAMHAAMTRNVFIDYFSPSRGLIVQRQARALAHHAINDSPTQQQHDKRGAPNKQRFRLKRRPEAHEFAVAVRHECEYRIVALAGNQHFAHLPAQIRGQ